jgi:hypothetical protein
MLSPWAEEKEDHDVSETKFQVPLNRYNEIGIIKSFLQGMFCIENVNFFVSKRSLQKFTTFLKSLFRVPFFMGECTS